MVSKLASRFNMTAEILGMKCSTVNESRAVSSVQLLCLCVLVDITAVISYFVVIQIY